MKPIAPVTAPGGIDATLAERGGRYGSFEHHAVIAQDLQNVIRGVDGGAAFDRMAPDQKQALIVITDKIARMLNGDPTYRDNWHDIVGYAKLVDDRMLRDEIAARPAPPPEEALIEINARPTRKGVEISAADYAFLRRKAGYK